MLLKRLHVLVFIEHGTRRLHERVIGTLRRELLDRTLILNEHRLALCCAST